MFARFEIGEVLLTAGMSDVFDRFLDRVIAGKVAPGQFAGERESGQPGHAGNQTKGLIAEQSVRRSSRDSSANRNCDPGSRPSAIA